MMDSRIATLGLLAAVAAASSIRNGSSLKSIVPPISGLPFRQGHDVNIVLYLEQRGDEARVLHELKDWFVGFGLLENKFLSYSARTELVRDPGNHIVAGPGAPKVAQFSIRHPSSPFAAKSDKDSLTVTVLVYGASDDDLMVHQPEGFGGLIGELVERKWVSSWDILSSHGTSGSPAKHDPRFLREVLDYWNNNRVSWEDVASKFGLESEASARTAVLRYAKKHKLVMRRATPVTSEDRREKALRLYEAGKSVKQIGAELGYPSSSVAAVVRRAKRMLALDAVYGRENNPLRAKKGDS